MFVKCMATKGAKNDIQEVGDDGTVSNFSGWLQRVRQTGEFSDLIVEVEGQEFYLHMLPLLNASLFFRTLSCSITKCKGHIGFYDEDEDGAAAARGDRSRKRVRLQLVGAGAKAFSVAADFCYLIRPNFTLQNVSQIRAVAEYLGMAELLDSTDKFLYANVFSHWKDCIAFLLQHKRCGSPAVDEYVETRCLKIISAACAKAFLATKYLSAPMIALASSSCAAAPASCCSNVVTNSSSSQYESTAPSTTASSANNMYSSTSGSGSGSRWQSASPANSQTLTDILVRTCSLQDEFVEKIIEDLVGAEVNLNLKCRQGRNVKGWLESTIAATECKSRRARYWLVICLARMLEKSVTSDRPWLELASQYWCCLLHQAGACMRDLQQAIAAAASTDHPDHVDEGDHQRSWRGNSNSTTQDSRHIDECSIKEISSLDRFWSRLELVSDFLERRIGGSLHELDDYLLSYKFEPRVLLSLVGHFRKVQAQLTETELEEVAVEVDACLWSFVQSASVSARHFIYLIQSFPPSSRKSHDSLYVAIEKLLTTTPQPAVLHLHEFTQQLEYLHHLHRDRHPYDIADAALNLAEGDEMKQQLWGLVDVSKLGPQYLDKALSNPVVQLSQPQVLQYVLKQHSQDLDPAKTTDHKPTCSVDHVQQEAQEQVQADVDPGQLRNIMQKVVKASLKLLEENSRKSLEIMALQKQCTKLLHQTSGSNVRLSISSGPDNELDDTHDHDTASCSSSSCDDHEIGSLESDHLQYNLAHVDDQWQRDGPAAAASLKTKIFSLKQHPIQLIPAVLKHNSYHSTYKIAQLQEEMEDCPSFEPEYQVEAAKDSTCSNLQRCSWAIAQV